uniref:RING-type domain-containing protein n=2 Tax=Amphora coffeiformis TaxID=265554 RepID=A0A7S3KXW6_9STRA
MFLEIFALFGIVLVLFLPLLVDGENRTLWLQRIRQCRWVPIGIDRHDGRSPAQTRPTVSKKILEQENALREAFVDEKLRDYTMQVTADSLSTFQYDQSMSGSAMIKRLVSVPTSITSPTNNDSSCHSTIDSSKNSSSALDSSQNGRVWLPQAGNSAAVAIEQQQQRQESSTCSICLSAFQMGDFISWASNPACPHLYHHACIKDWVLASGRKHAQATWQRRCASQEGILMSFPMTCPCCRQPFILSPVTTETGSNISRPDATVEHPPPAHHQRDDDVEAPSIHVPETVVDAV